MDDWTRWVNAAREPIEREVADASVALDAQSHLYVWIPDSGQVDGGELLRCWQGRWTCTDVWRDGEWLSLEVDIRFEGFPVTEAAAMRYCAGGPAPTSLDRPERRPLSVAAAAAAAEALAEEEWPGLDGVREVLLDYSEQFEVDEADELPEDPDPGQED